VVGDLFTFVNRGYEFGVDNGTTLSQFVHFTLRKNTVLRETFCGEEFHFEHGVESMLVTEEFATSLANTSESSISSRPRKEQCHCASLSLKDYERRRFVGATARFDERLGDPGHGEHSPAGGDEAPFASSAVPA